MRRAAGDDVVQDRAQQVDIAGDADLGRLAHGHLGRHVGRRAGDIGDRRRLGDRERQAPVHQHHLAEIPEHHVLGFQVAVQHAAGVGKGDGVGHLHQDLQVLGQRLAPQVGVPGPPLDPLHRVEQRAILVLAQVVDRHDVRVFQFARHHGFAQEFLARTQIGLLVRPQHLDRHGAVDGRLASGRHQAHAALAQDVEHFVVGLLSLRLAALLDDPGLDHDVGPRFDRSPAGLERRRTEDVGADMALPQSYHALCDRLIAVQRRYGPGRRRLDRGGLGRRGFGRVARLLDRRRIARVVRQHCRWVRCRCGNVRRHGRRRLGRRGCRCHRGVFQREREIRQPLGGQFKTAARAEAGQRIVFTQVGIAARACGHG